MTTISPTTLHHAYQWCPTCHHYTRQTCNPDEAGSTGLVWQCQVCQRSRELTAYAHQQSTRPNPR